MIKLVVGVDTLDEFAQIQKRDVLDYHGASANPVYTRHRPKRSDELTRDGSIYRVIKNRIVCRQKIIGFDEIEHPVKGKMCVIMVDPQIHTTIQKPKRPFQGWRYLEPAAAPKDTGVYLGEEDRPPEDMAQDLAESGLL